MRGPCATFSQNTPRVPVMPSTLFVAATVIVVLIALNAFFSLAETALTAASRARMMSLEKDGDRGARNGNHECYDRD